MIKLLQYVYGFVGVRLDAVSSYATERIDVISLDERTYVGVENLLPERQGKTESSCVPNNGACIEYKAGDILVGNIRPYLKKIWFADCNGGTNGDVLVIRCDGNCILPRYLYYVLSSDGFFAYDMQYSKGAKMPRGDKGRIMEYKVWLPPVEEQERIVSILDRFDRLCNDLSEGLPAELDARQKQYEHYRDRIFESLEERAI